MTDQPQQRHDDCPDCGERRTELTIAAGRFYCPRCERAGEGPAPLRVGSQLTLEETFGVQAGTDGPGVPMPSRQDEAEEVRR